MNKNFLDTQTGGTSEVASENKGKSQKTDLSPKQAEDIRKANESEPSAENQLNIDLNKEQDAEERVDAIESGETKEAATEISAENSTPNKILSGYKEEEAKEEKSVLDVIYNKANKESQISEEDLVDKSELNESTPVSSVTDFTMETSKGAIIPTGVEEEYSYDPELDKEFREMPDGTMVSSLDGTTKDVNTNNNFFKREDQEFFTFDGKPIKRDRVIPESEKNRLKGESEEAEPGYYTFKGKRYLKTADGDWQQIKYKERYSRAKRAYVTTEKLMKLNDRHSRILESNGFFQFNEDNASKQLLEDFMYGRENINIDYSKNKYAPEEEIVVAKKDVPEVAVPGYRNFNYSGDKVSDLDERVKDRKEKYQAKPDGEYQWNGKNFAKKDGKWYRVTEGRDEPTGLLTKTLDKFNIGSDLELKEVKYSDVVDIEIESIFTKKSKDYLEKTIYDLVQSFENKVQSFLKKTANNVIDSNVDRLIDSDDFKTEPIFDFVDEFTDRLGIDLDERGFTTSEIERAEAQVYQLYGGVLNEAIEKERVKFDLSNEFLFTPNPYDLEAAKDRVDRTFFQDFNFAPKQVKKQVLDDMTFPLSDYEVSKYRGMGYLSENNTFSPPKTPGIYFLGNDYARKVDDGQGRYSWIDSSGNPITDTRKKALYESSSYDDQTINTTIGGFTPISAMAFRENEKLYSSLKISDDYEVEGKGEKVNVKDLSVYKMIFNDSSLSSFLAESSSSLSSDPYFLELLKAYQSEGDFYSGSDLLKSISNSKDLSGVNLNDVDEYFVSFAHKLEKEIQEYNDYVSSESSLKYFVLNIDKFKEQANKGIDKESFDSALDSFGLQAISILASDLSDNDSKIQRTKNLKQEILVWKENLEKTNDKIREISESGMTVSQYMFANKLKTLQTLGNIGNSKQLNDAINLWNINKQLLDNIQFKEELNASREGDVSMGWDYIGSATEEKIKSLEEQSEQYLRQKSVDFVNEKSEIKSKIDNINKAIPFLESIYYEDYKYDDAILDNYREAGGSYADIPEDLELDENQKAELKLRIEILNRTKNKLISELEENESSSLGFFRTNPQSIIDGLSENGDQIKSYVAAIPSGEGFSSKDKFDMMFEQMNQRRLGLEQKLNLSGESISSAIEIRLDKLKDLFFTDLSPAEKEYYQLVYNLRLLTPIYLNNTQSTKAEINGFFNSLWGGIFEFAFPHTSKAAGSLMMGKGRVVNISSSPKQQLRDIAAQINKMQESKKVEGKMELTSDASEEFSANVGWAMREDSIGDRDFWGNTLGVTLGIIYLFNKANSWTKLGYRGVIGTERLIRKSPKKFKSIVAKSVKKYQKKYNAVMSRNRLTKHLIGPSLAYGTQFKITGTIFNDEKVGKELTFSAGFAGGLLSQGFVKGLPFLTRKAAGMTKGQYQAYMRGVFGSDSSSIMKTLNTLSRLAGWGTAEFLQETGEELTHAWEDSENGRDFFKVLDQRFGTLDQKLRFAVSTFVMGLAFGIGAKGGLGDAISNLNEEQFQVYDKITKQIKGQHDAAVKEAELARKEYTQNAVNAANATTSKETKEDDSKNEERVSSEKQVGEESVETKPVEEKGKEKTGDSGVVQEEQVDPYEQFNKQKKTRKVWNIEFQSDDIVNNLQKRGEDGDFVEGTSESNVLDVFNTLTDEQQQQVRDMSKNANGKTIKPYLVYQKILSLGKDNAQNQSKEVNEVFDVEGDVKAIEEYSNQLNEDVQEAKKLISEEEAISKGLDADINSEIEQTLLAQNQGEMSYTDEQGNIVTEQTAQEEAAIEDQIKDYNSLSEENKKLLRARAKAQLLEEEQARRARKERKSGKQEKGRATSKKQIEQRAERLFNEAIEQREKQLLGPRTMEIDSERATLTYNQSKSDDTNSIVYDINDETGSTGQISGNYNKDGDFVITDVSSTRAADNFEQEAVEAIAELVDGDVIISGKSDLGQQMHKDDMVIEDFDGNYVLVNKGSKKQGRKAKPGDGIRSFKILATQGGITLNSGPGANLYNAALEVAAKIVDAGGSVVKAVSAARDAYRNSNHYKNLKAEEQATSMAQIEIAIRESLNTEEFIQLEATTEKAVSQAVKEFQKTEAYKTADRKTKARLTKEFKQNLQARIDEKVSIGMDQETRAEGYEMLKKAKESKTKFEEKIDIKNEILKLKSKAKNLKEGSKAMDDIKSRIIKYIKQNIPTGVKYTASEVKSLVTTVQQAKTAESLEKAFDKVDDMVAKKAGQKLTEARKKLKSRISPTNLRKALTRKKGGRRKAKVDAYTVDSIKSYISQLGGMDAISEMNLDEIKEFNEVLDGIINEGKTDFKAAQKLLHSAKRKAQGEIILGFDSLALERKNKNVKSISDLKKHLNTRGNFVIIGGKYYTKTDFKENEAEALANFKKLNPHFFEESMSKEQIAESLKFFNDVVVDNMISFEGLEGNIDYNADDFGAFYSQTPSQKSKVRSRGLAGRANPFTASMDVYGLLIKAYSGPVIGSRKGNNYLKDFINKNIAEKMPIAFARTQQQTYEISQEHKAKLEEIFGKGSLDKALKKGEEAFRIMLFGGFAKIPKILRTQADLSEDVLGSRERRVPTNDQVVHIYNMSRNPADRDRLENQGVDVDAIVEYVKNFEGSTTEEYIDEETGEVATVTRGSKLEQYADYLMDFYNTRARELYEESYEKYTEGMKFESEKEQIYYPTSAELTNDESKQEQSIMDLITSGAGSQVSMNLNPGSFQTKTGKGNLNLDKGASEIFADYNKQNTRYKNFSDIINSVSALYGNQNLTDIMEENMGSNAFNKLKNALSDSISGEANMMGQIPIIASLINSVGVVGTLSFKPQQIAKQATSFMHFWNAGIKYGLKGDNPGLFIGMVPTNNPFAATFGLVNSQTRDFEMSLMKSAFVTERWLGGGSSLDIDLRNAQEFAKKNNRSLFDELLTMPSKAISSASNPLLITTRMGDMAGVLFGPGGGMTFAVNMYKKFKKEGMSHEEAKTRAIEIFQIEATQSQQTTQVDNLSAAQKQVIFRMAGMYRTSQSAAAKKTMRAVNAMFDGTKKSKKEKAQIAADFIYFGIFSPMLFTAVTTGFVMSALSLTGTVDMAAVERDDEDKVFARHAYDWIADNAQSLLQGYGYGGILSDHFLNVARDRDYFNSVPILKVLDKMTNSSVETLLGGKDRNSKSEELSTIENIAGYIGAEKNVTQLVELYDLMVADKKDWRKILNKTMNWQDRYLQPAYDYGKDDVLFEQMSKMWIEGGEEYMHEVTPVKDVYKRHTYEEKTYKDKSNKDKTYKEN